MSVLRESAGRKSVTVDLSDHGPSICAGQQRDVGDGNGELTSRTTLLAAAVLLLATRLPQRGAAQREGSSARWQAALDSAIPHGFGRLRELRCWKWLIVDHRRTEKISENSQAIH